VQAFLEPRKLAALRQFALLIAVDPFDSGGGTRGRLLRACAEGGGLCYPHQGQSSRGEFIRMTKKNK